MDNIVEGQFTLFGIGLQTYLKRGLPILAETGQYLLAEGPSPLLLQQEQGYTLESSMGNDVGTEQRGDGPMKFCCMCGIEFLDQYYGVVAW